MYALVFTNNKHIIFAFIKKLFHFLFFSGLVFEEGINISSN